MRGLTPLVASVTAALLLAVAATAAPGPTKPMVAILSPEPMGDPDSALPGFFEGLRALGDEDGRNIAVAARYADWKFDSLPALAKELVALKPAVLFTYTSQGVRAATQVTTTIPIVVGAASDLILQGYTSSLAHPSANVTGLTLIDTELRPKRVELLRGAIPRIARLTILINPTNPSPINRPSAIEAQFGPLGLRLHLAQASTPAQLDAAFDEMVATGTDAALVDNDIWLNAHARRIASLAIRHGLPTTSETRGFVLAGGLMSYGPNIREMFRRAATHVDRLLKGARPGELPIERPDRFTLSVNLKTARALGLTLPPSFLARADLVIE